MISSFLEGCSRAAEPGGIRTRIDAASVRQPEAARHRRSPRRGDPSGLWRAGLLPVAALLALASAPASAVRAGESDEERVAAGIPPALERAVDFDTEVRPILEERCLRCHGAKRQRGDLRLDLRSAALRGGHSGPALVPGDGERSLLVRAVAGLEDDLRMPPKGDALTPEETALLRTWIDRGADWGSSEEVVPEPHASPERWAFRAPEVDAAPPRAAELIDRRVHEKLEAVGLAPSPPEERRTLGRRLFLDVVGVPPSPEALDEFVRDDDPEAVEKLVDSLLASPRHGERWARHWLDVVRFAETNGFETNTPRKSAWPYRDWVIDALNQDLPYDRFVFAQIAGDQIGEDAATGFLVGGPYDQVKSPDKELTLNQRANELHDMVSTTGAAFLGLTVGCARCHNHKFDPISQRDYYALTGVFQGVQHGEREWRRPQEDGATASRDALRRRIEELEAETSAIVAEAHPGRTVWLDDDGPLLETDGAARVEELVPAQGPAAHAEGAERGARGDPGAATRYADLGRGYRYWRDVAGRDVFAWRPHVSGRFRIFASWGCGWSTHSSDARYLLDLDGDPSTRNDQTQIARVDHRRFADGSGDTPGRPLWSGFLDLGAHELGEDSALLLRGGDDDAYLSADLVVFQSALEGAPPHPRPRLRPAPGARHVIERFAPVTADRIRFTVLATSSGEPCIDELEVFSADEPTRNLALATLGARARSSSDLPGYAIHRLEHIHDGRYGNARSWISNERGAGWVEIRLAEPSRIDRVEWARDREGRFADRVATEYRIEASTDGESWTLLASSEDRLPSRLTVAVQPPHALAASLDPERAERLAERVEEGARLRTELESRGTARQVYAGRFTSPAENRLLHRGDPMHPRDPIAPGGLRAVGPELRLEAEAPDVTRRVSLARWIASDENPLTARVITNRVWHYHFGRGLVATPSDFGANGARPTHPELLDELAIGLVREGWSLKRLHRAILTSRTYRQSSRPRPEALDVDAESRWLWRYPPRRLEAEPIRDSMLAVTGALDLRMGGPGYEVFEPNDSYVHVYVPKRAFGPADWRRMIYQFKPRMEQDETFGVFDCPDGAQMAPRRTRSTTPLQALNLLNSPFVLQQARLFAERLVREADSTEARVDRAFRLAFGRHPEPTERAAAGEVATEHGLETLCRALLNANEFLYSN